MSFTTVKYSLSPRQAMYLDVPIGDPYGGPAYGQKLKGGGGMGMVLGVVAAVATGGVGLAAWSAASAAGSIGGMLSAGAMMAGGVMSGIGAVTGNKKLSKYGGYLSLAGGLGASMMTSGGEFLNPLAENAGKESLMSEAMTKVSDTFSSAAEKLGLAKDTTTPGLAGPNQGVTEGLKANGLNPMAEAQQGAQATMPLADAGSSGNTLQQAVANTQSGTIGLSTPTDAVNYSTQASNLSPGATMPGRLPVAGVDSTASTLASNTGFGASGSGVTGGSLNPTLTSTLPKTAATGGSSLVDGALSFAKSNGGGLIGSALMQGVGGAMSQQEQLDFIQQQYSDKQDLMKQELAKVNFQYEVLDPNDPQYEQKKAAAKSSGIPTITLGVNKNANVAMPNMFPATQQPVAQNQGVQA